MKFLSLKTYDWYMYIYYLMSISAFMIYLFKANYSILWEWVIYESMDMSIVISLSFTLYNVIFVFTVSSVFASVYHYSIYYMTGEIYVKRFMLILILFVISMVILICSGNLFTTLIGWDGLGVTSMLLIMYYCSNASLKASMYTFVINRLGDCFFLILIFFIMCKFPTLNLLVNTMSSNLGMLFCCLFILLSITKSAQVPFSSWLTKAMEAPTPVSSLVHSSTLVTAGIYVLFLYQEVWKESEIFVFILSTLSLATILVASIAGLVEMDLKKIVAYSTLSQLGFIMFVFSLSLFPQGFFHLIMHAFFKALMFMSAGYIIHHSSGWQDIRLMSLNFSCSPIVVKILTTAMVSLCGLPYMSGFFSKDLILDSLCKMNFSVLIFLILICSFVFTVYYSFRVCWYVMSGLKPVSSMTDDSSGMIKTMLYLLVLSCTMGSMMLWTFYPSTPSFDSPKIILVMFLVGMLIIFWNFSSVKKNMFYLKTNMYLYVVINLIVYKFMVFFQKLAWFSDLLGLIGKTLKLPSLILDEIMSVTKDKAFLINFKEFMFLGLMMVLVFMLMTL
uniref:NADH:ubiquinone reductase (H(+)-translocating) n=1 Tax=Colpocephalum eucarenum TaxID=2965266 RepID=A0A9Y1YS97_9NEOP|nr:NADH dehydrogenase subunit 5 [Colpocephalum eucarenum]WIM51512.1 NADH dehydrogenase subunit 5 [Colpocephalum eucarenum]